MTTTTPQMCRSSVVHATASGLQPARKANSLLRDIPLSRPVSLLLGIIFWFVAVCPALSDAGHEDGGIDLAGMDRSVRPGNDFYNYANGEWIKNAEIPPDRSSYGAGPIVHGKTDVLVRGLIEEVAATPNQAQGSVAQKVGDYYASYMDDVSIESKGIAPLKPEFARITAIKDKKALSSYLGTTLRADVDPLNNTNFYTDHIFGVWIAQAFDDPAHNVPYLLQGGLGLPDRDYYLQDSPEMASIRAKYLSHVSSLLKFQGPSEGDTDARASRILALETKIAKAHWSLTDSEDVHKANNPWSTAEFVVRAPGLDWNGFFQSARLADQARFIVWQPSAIVGISALVASEPLEAWKDYLTVRLIDHYSAVLSKAFVDEQFAFYGTTLAGTPKLSDRWKRAIDATNAALGQAVGQLYVERYFPPEAKRKMEVMVRDLLVAYRARLSHLTWLSPQTKAKALAKLNNLKIGVGYPDRWPDYSPLRVVRGDAFGNLERAEQFEYDRNLAKLTGPVDRSEWVVYPHVLDAVNLPLANAINFPAAFLQPPFFDPEGDSAINYGAIGATIGHEISHCFDDQGSQFDPEGRMVMWWTPEDLAHFQEVSRRLIAQFDAYHPFPDLAVNGKQTLSENIADIAGLSAAHDAWILSLNGSQPQPLQGFTGEQRFFLAFAQSWRAKFREAAARQQILTDSHAPPTYRGDAVRNLDTWYSAFDVKQGQSLYLAPNDRVQIW